MSWWIELHCDRRAEPVTYNRRCYSEDNNNVMEGFSNRSGEWGLKQLRKAAREQGWKYRRGLGWVCPYCQTQPKGKEE